MKLVLLLTVTGIGALLMQDQSAPKENLNEHVGKRADGSFLLNSGWTLRPAGEQVGVDTLPMSAVVSTSGKYLLVLNCGYNPPSISVIDIAARKEVGRTRVPDAWLGLALDRKTGNIYVGGGAKGIVYGFHLDETTGKIEAGHEYPLQTKTPRAFIGDVALSSDGRTLYAADLYGDGIIALNVETAVAAAEWKTGRRPYRILITPGDRRIFVSSWADGAVDQLDVTGQLINKTRVGPHATDMLLISKPAPSEDGKTETVARLFVATSNTNSISSFGVTRDGATSALETINLSLTALQPLGMTPSSIAADPSGNRIYVACSDANSVAVVDISQPQSRVVGQIPTGWYPTAVTTLPGNELTILNGKGLGSYPNPNGPNPTQKNRPLYQGGPVVSPGYVGHIQTGTAAFLKVPDQAGLDEYTKTVRENTPYRDDLIDSPIEDAQTAYFTNTRAHPSPVKQIIYIIKENRTYDQVLGDLGKGNGDKSLTLFGAGVTPNLHKLASDYILYDNFYENADVSADGHNWAAAAIAPDYTVKTWPSEYAGRRHNYDFEGGEPANTPPAGYLWTNALEAGLTVRGYGEWVENAKLGEVQDGVQVKTVRDPLLAPHTDMHYRGFDLDYPDVDRAREFLREWTGFNQAGRIPQISIVRMGNDHTSGTAPGKLSPRALAADNDYAVGLLVDGVSHSKAWQTTAIFIIEDDAQNGPDHVDSHRAPAFIISPFTHRGTVDGAMYNQTSILRSIELIVGLRPLTHFDAAARPMFAGWTRQPDATPYTALPPVYSLTERNAGNAAGSRESARMDFRHEDQADDDELNEVLWRAIKGGEPPAPTRSSFGR